MSGSDPEPMSGSDPTPDSRDLWRKAARRLRLADAEPPLDMARVDALQALLGPRGKSESLRDWLDRGHAQATPEARAEAAHVVDFDARRQRFTRIASVVRLAADSGGPGVPLPARDLETEDGRFRFRVSLEGDQLAIGLQALGLASEDFAGRTLGLASADDARTPVIIIELDDDADGAVRLPDTDEIRRTLLWPVIGLIEDR